jgi:serine/threonine protein phosphatase 1
MRYALSDLHGCRNTFHRALKEIEFTKQDTLIIVGDIYDRGPDCKGIIDDVLVLQRQGYNIVMTIGNHEIFALEATKGEGIYKMWIGQGGAKTLLSYGITDPYKDWTAFQKAIPDRHWEFLDNLPNIYELEDYVFVHAGLDFKLDNPLTETPEDFMLWERNGWVNFDQKKIGNRMLVVGHTPTSKQNIIASLDTGLINIDRGCIFKGADYNHLAVLNLDTKWFRFIKNIDEINTTLYM